MSSSEIILKIKLRWWFINLYIPYLKIIMSIKHLLGLSTVLDSEKVNYWIKRGIYFENI